MMSGSDDTDERVPLTVPSSASATTSDKENDNHLLYQHRHLPVVLVAVVFVAVYMMLDAQIVNHDLQTTSLKGKTVKRIPKQNHSVSMANSDWSRSVPLTLSRINEDQMDTMAPNSPYDHTSIPFFNYTARGAALERYTDIRGNRNFGRGPESLRVFLQHIPKSGGSSLFENYLLPYKDDLCPTCVFKNHHVQPLAKRPLKKTYDLDMSESPYDPVTLSNTSLDNNVATFTLIRNPQHHVLSQYFHCTESQWARKSRGLMPQRLDDWLDFWIGARHNGTVEQYNETQAPFLYEPFRCYRPVNMLTQFTNGMTSIEDLQQKFFAIGITDQMVQSSCVIGTRLFGKVPSGCDCSQQVIVHNTTRINHNVSHHGDSYQLSAAQRQKIAALTELDEILYQNALLVFQQEVKQLEAEFGVRLCDK